MKIGFVCNSYLPFVGGVEIHARQVSQELSKRHDVTLAAMNFGAMRLPARLATLHNNLFAPPAADRVDGKVTVRSLTPSLARRAVMLPLALRAAPRLQRWFYHEIRRLTHPFYAAAIVPRMKELLLGCDVIHGLVQGDICWAAQKVARSLGIPFVCTPFVHPQQWGDGPDDVAHYRRSDAVIGLVRTDRDYLQSLGVPKEKLHVVGVSPDLPASTNGTGFRERHQLGTSPVILYVGRMMQQKGAPAILAAAQDVWQKQPEARFVFIGPASRDEMEIFKAKDPRILYLGRVEPQEKGDALAACDIFCMPSTSEILPTVYLEAWSLGKPVIGGTARGLRELVEENGAGFVSEQSAEPLAKQLLRMLDDAVLRQSCGEAGRKLVDEKYSVEAVTSQLESIYRGVCERS